jgi:hypothetical protein
MCCVTLLQLLFVAVLLATFYFNRAIAAEAAGDKGLAMNGGVSIRHTATA